MAAIVRVLARALPKESLEVEILKQIALFCGAGLLVSLLMLTYGLDLSVGLFSNRPACGISPSYFDGQCRPVRTRMLPPILRRVRPEVAAIGR